MELGTKGMGGEMLGPPSGKPCQAASEIRKASWAFGVSAAFGASADLRSR